MEENGEKINIEVITEDDLGTREIEVNTGETTYIVVEQEKWEISQ
ncbi:MAG: hypothetical protein PQJ59_10245 [Spirochaetales bacterium]|nr:hypothetical protein [Spirochaetales bacterium]